MNEFTARELIIIIIITSARDTSRARATLGSRLVAALSLAKGAKARLWYTRGCTVLA